MRQTSFGQSVRNESAAQGFPHHTFPATLPRGDHLLLERRYERFPYVPSDPTRRDERVRKFTRSRCKGSPAACARPGLRRVVIGISGGIDSTQALLVCAQAMDRLKYPRRNVLAYTMPGFATSARTLEQARAYGAIDCEAHELDIRPSACRCSRTSAILTSAATTTTTSPSRTYRRASAPTICSGSPI